MFACGVPEVVSPRTVSRRALRLNGSGCGLAACFPCFGAPYGGFRGSGLPLRGDEFGMAESLAGRPHAIGRLISAAASSRTVKQDDLRYRCNRPKVVDGSRPLKERSELRDGSLG